MRRLLFMIPFLGFLAGYFIPVFFFQQACQQTPSIIGKSLQDAVVLLSNQNLNAQVIKEQEDAVLPEGMVVHQAPGPLQPIKKHQTVSLGVSKKPLLANVPYVVGKTASEINSVLSKSGAFAEGVFIPSSYPSLKCIAQFPQSGTPLTKKSIVTYVASGKKLSSIIPDFTGFDCGDVKDYLHTIPLLYQFFSHGVLVPDRADFDGMIVTSQRPLAGTIIDLEKPPMMQFEIE